jgi:hypothetical protein
LLFIIGSLINLLGGLFLIKKFNFVPSAVWIGKIAALSMIVTFLLNIVNYDYIDYLYYISALLLIASIIVYTIKSINIIKTKN